MRARWMNGYGGQVAQLDASAARGSGWSRAADEVEVVAAEHLGLQLRRLGAHGREREVGRAASHPLDAGLREHVGDVELDARVTLAGSAPARRAASPRRATAAAAIETRPRRCAAWSRTSARRRRSRASTRRAAVSKSRALGRRARRGAWCGRTGERPALLRGRAISALNAGCERWHRGRGAREVALLGQERRRRATGGSRQSSICFSDQCIRNFRFHRLQRPA